MQQRRVARSPEDEDAVPNLVFQTRHRITQSGQRGIETEQFSIGSGREVVIVLVGSQGLSFSRIVHRNAHVMLRQYGRSLDLFMDVAGDGAAGEKQGE